MLYLVAQHSSLMKRNTGTVKDSSAHALHVELRTFMIVSLMVRLVVSLFPFFILWKTSIKAFSPNYLYKMGK